MVYADQTLVLIEILVTMTDRKTQKKEGETRTKGVDQSKSPTIKISNQENVDAKKRPVKSLPNYDRCGLLFAASSIQ